MPVRIDAKLAPEDASAAQRPTTVMSHLTF
jgi:hypothetical protein